MSTPWPEVRERERLRRYGELRWKVRRASAGLRPLMDQLGKGWLAYPGRGDEYVDVPNVEAFPTWREAYAYAYAMASSRA